MTRSSWNDLLYILAFVVLNTPQASDCVVNSFTGTEDFFSNVLPRYSGSVFKDEWGCHKNLKALVVRGCRRRSIPLFPDGQQDTGPQHT